MIRTSVATSASRLFGSDGGGTARDGVAVLRHRQPEVAAEHVAVILATEQATRLKDRHDLTEEAVKIGRARDVQLEPVNRAGGKPALDLVSDGSRRADER